MSTVRNNRRRPRVKQKKIKYVRANVSSKKLSTFVIVSIFLLFAMSLLLTIAFSNVSVQRTQNARLSNELMMIETVNNNLYIQIVDARQIEDVDTIAREQLGMGEPRPYQVHFVELVPERFLQLEHQYFPEIQPSIITQMTDTFFNLITFFRGD